MSTMPLQASQQTRERGWKMSRGANMIDFDHARFTVWCPYTKTPAVRIYESADSAKWVDYPLAAVSDEGLYEGLFRLEGRRYYSFVLDGGIVRPDPCSRSLPKGVHGCSEIIDPRDFEWSDLSWAGIEARDLIIYELHVAAFTAEGTFEAVISRLPYLKSLGVNCIQLMPVNQFPGTRNWGYDGVGIYAAQNSYGGPTGLKRLIDAAHRHDLAVLLDVVYNHLGPEGNYLRDFGPYYTDRYHTPWGDALNFDGPDCDEVRRYFIDNALYWLYEYHIDGLRLDAVHTMYDNSAIHILDEIAQMVHQAADYFERPILAIAESDRNDPRLLKPREQGGFEYDAMWNDEFHHALYAYLTQDKKTYLADYGKLSQVAKVMTEKFVLDGSYSIFRKRRHGAVVKDLPAEKFIAFLQNHDQVGNRPCGERISDFVEFPLHRAAVMFLLASPFPVMFFMGDEYRETNSFCYFVDFGESRLLELIREGRKNDFAFFDWPTEIPSPESEATFVRSKLHPEEAEREPHRQMFALYQALLRLRREQAALIPDNAEIELWFDAAEDWIAYLLHTRSGSDLLEVYNFGAERRSIVLETGGAFRPLITTVDGPFLSSAERGEHVAIRGAEGRLQVEMPGSAGAVFIRTGIEDGHAS